MVRFRMVVVGCCFLMYAICQLLLQVVDEGGEL